MSEQPIPPPDEVPANEVSDGPASEPAVAAPEHAPRTATGPDPADAEPLSGGPAPEASVGAPWRAPALGVAASALALIAIAVGGYLWWQQRQLSESVEQNGVDTAVALERLENDLTTLSARLEGMTANAAASERAAAELAARLEEAGERFAALEQRLNAVQGVSLQARQQWLKAEAEYYLSVANAELRLFGHWERAITGLELADGKLRELGAASFAGVRDLIAQELIELRSVESPDIEGLSYSLGRLAERATELAMRAEPPPSFANSEGAADAAPGLGRLWLGIKQALAGMIRVERREEPVPRALTGEERALTRRLFALELANARLALARGQSEVFRQSLGAARTLLARDFDATAAPVQSAIELVTGMMALDVAPQRPDISASLTLLRTLPAGAQ